MVMIWPIPTNVVCGLFVEVLSSDSLQCGGTCGAPVQQVELGSHCTPKPFMVQGRWRACPAIAMVTLIRGLSSKLLFLTHLSCSG